MVLRGLLWSMRRTFETHKVDEQLQTDIQRVLNLKMLLFVSLASGTATRPSIGVVQSWSELDSWSYKSELLSCHVLPQIWTQDFS